MVTFTFADIPFEILRYEIIPWRIENKKYERKIWLERITNLAMNYPKEYIQLRNTLLSKINDKINKEYIKIYEEYISDCTHKESTHVAISHSKYLMKEELSILEIRYPSTFHSTSLLRN